MKISPKRSLEQCGAEITAYFLQRLTNVSPTSHQRLNEFSLKIFSRRWGNNFYEIFETIFEKLSDSFRKTVKIVEKWTDKSCKMCLEPQNLPADVFLSL